MQCSARLDPVRTAEATLSLKGYRRPALLAAVVGGILLGMPLVAFSERNAAAESAELVARTCAALDLKAEDAIARRIRRPETRRQDIARTAQAWLAEARRHCSAGDPEQAELLYQRIIAVNDLPG